MYPLISIQTFHALVHQNPPKSEETELETWQKESSHLAEGSLSPDSSERSGQPNKLGWKKFTSR